jgi:hypothetical protein
MTVSLWHTWSASRLKSSLRVMRERSQYRQGCDGIEASIDIVGAVNRMRLDDQRYGFYVKSQLS